MKAWLVALFAAALPALAGAPEDFFENRIRPLLAEKCGACHIRQSAGGLRLDSRAALLHGGSRGAAIEPGNAAASLLLRAVRHSDEKLKMPPGARLPDTDVQALDQWIASGAAWPATAAKPAIDADFWSFRALPPPEGSIDQHVRAGLAAKGLPQNPPADRRTLLRRLTFDLTGLPPSPDQARRFLREKQIVVSLVEELLASPRFGERWGRHWLDVARFGEDDFSGTERKPYPNAWRYRDWVIDAFNHDLPYDEFLRAQIAADLYPRHKDNLAALGLFGLGPWYYGITQPPQARADERHDRVDMISRGLLGLTAACARCHDHKYDPIAQRDYYALSGVFASSKYKLYPLADAGHVEAYERSQQQIKKLEKEIAAFLNTQRDQLAEIYARQSAAFLTQQPGVDAEVARRWEAYLAKPEEDHPFLKPWQDASPGNKPAAAAGFQRTLLAVIERKKELDENNRKAVIRGTVPDRKRRKEILPFQYDSEADFNPGSEVPTESLDRERYQLWLKFISGPGAVYRLDDAAVEARFSGDYKQHLDRLRSKLAEAKKAAPDPYPYLNGIAEHEEPMDLPLNVRGNPFQLGDPVPRRFLPCLTRGEAVPLTAGSGRQQLVEAIVSHPIAARVMANRVWTWLTGAGVVRTPSNFGAMGERPSNPALLDHLAARFKDRNFSMKALIREIVLSQSYQAASAHNPAAAKLDPDNRLFWRANRRRLDAESIRDAILFVSGDINLRAGGDSEPLSDGNLRRTVYVNVSRYQQNETMSLFDFPSASIHAERRNVTNVPLQKLFFLNSTFLDCRADALAVRAPDTAGVYELLFQRAPDAAERDAARQFSAAQPWRAYVKILLSTNEFLYLD